MQQRLVAVQQYEPARLVLGHLAGDLAADRASSTSDEDNRTGEAHLDIAGMDGRVGPSEKVGDVEVTKAAEQRTGDPLGGRWQDLHLRLGCESTIDDGLAVLAVGDRDQDAIDSVCLADGVELRRRSEYREPAHGAPLQSLVVVDEPDNAHRVVRLAVAQLVGERGATVTGPGDQHAHRLTSWCGLRERCRSTAYSLDWNRVPPTPISASSAAIGEATNIETPTPVTCDSAMITSDDAVVPMATATTTRTASSTDA